MAPSWPYTVLVLHDLRGHLDALHVNPKTLSMPNFGLRDRKGCVPLCTCLQSLQSHRETSPRTKVVQMPTVHLDSEQSVTDNPWRARASTNIHSGYNWSGNSSQLHTNSQSKMSMWSMWTCICWQIFNSSPPFHPTTTNPPPVWFVPSEGYVKLVRASGSLKKVL